jgi:hypothetical protein
MRERRIERKARRGLCVLLPKPASSAPQMDKSLILKVLDDTVSWSAKFRIS